MSFQGMIEDVAVADVMQLIRIGGHSGSLTVNNGQEEGIIGFERGRIVSAWNPRTLRVGELLMAAGDIDATQLAAALAAQNNDRPRRTVGHYLVRMGATTPEAIRDVMAREIERVVGEICAWKSGSFDFAIDDLTPLIEVTRFTGAPKVDLDTQTVLMDVLRRMEEGGAPAPTPEEVVAEPTADRTEEELPQQHFVASGEFEAPGFESETRGRGMLPAGLTTEREASEAIPHAPAPLARLALGVHYAEPAAAARWLRDVFGFEPAGNIPDTDSGKHSWIEFHVGNSALMVFKRPGEPTAAGPARHTPWVFVDDLDAHYARAKAGGATITDEIWQHGTRAYGASDLEGNRWTFAQAMPLMR